MNKTIPVIATLLIATPAVADVTFPLSVDPNNRIEVVVRANNRNYYSESGHGYDGAVLTFDTMYSKGSYQAIVFYEADCSSAYRYRSIAAGYGNTAAEINANIVPNYSNPFWQKIDGGDPAAIKAKNVCNDFLLLNK